MQTVSNRKAEGRWRAVRNSQMPPRFPILLERFISILAIHLVYTMRHASSLLPMRASTNIMTERTWKGFQTLSHDLIDLLVAHCEEDETQGVTGEAHGVWISTDRSPFGVFKLNSGETNPKPDFSLPASSPLASVAIALATFADTTRDERFLFHHYVTHVAPLMVPNEHPRNPWKMHYPAAAMNQISPHQKALHSAILAHAAFNIAHLQDGDFYMFEVASKHYGMAMRHLLPQFTHSDDVDFTVMIAVVMSLMFAEVCHCHDHVGPCIPVLTVSK